MGWPDLPEYRVWVDLKQRCLNPNHRSYARYGGAGVGICEQWADSFEAFYAHVGRRPATGYRLALLDRSAGYEPGNVRWAARSPSPQEQTALTVYSSPVPLAGQSIGRPYAETSEDELRVKLTSALLALNARLESEESRRAYRHDWRRWCVWLSSLGVNVLFAEPLHVQQYLAQLHVEGKAKSTRARALAIIRSTYAALVVGFSDIADVLNYNPAREVVNIKVSADPRTPWLSADELKRLLTRPGPSATWVHRRDWLICATLTGTGWRRSEVARMCVEHLLPTAGGVAARVRAKGGKEAIVALPTWLAHEIETWCGSEGIQSGPIFPQSQESSKAVGPTTIRNAVKRLARLAGLDLSRATPHAIRRSFATITGQRGVSLEDRQIAMLHSSKTTTERYDKAATLPSESPGEKLADFVKA